MSSTDLAAAPENQRPTRIRHVVVAAATLMALLLYLDRFCISFVEIFIKEDLKLSDGQISTIVAVFFWTYGLAQVPTGWLTDRYGARRMLSLYIVSWSLFTALSGLATGFWSLLLLRAMFGMAQAGAYPASASLLRKWVPFSARGTASGIVSSGGRLGGVLAPLLSAVLLLAFVPREQPSTLTSADILDAPRLARDLAGPVDSAEPASSDTSNSAPEASAPETLSVQRQIGGRILELATSRQDEAVLRLRAIQDPKDVEAADIAALAELMNAALTWPGLYQPQWFADLKLESEARRLAEQPWESLTEIQQQRRNRLLLEAVYSSGVRKLYGVGWRPMLWTYGFAGLLVAGLFIFAFRDTPDQHPLCNEAERALIRGHQPPVAPPKLDFPLQPILKSRDLWLSSLSQATTNFGWVFLLTWMPRYFLAVHDTPVVLRGLLSSGPVLIGMFGMVCGGPLTDVLTRKLGQRWGRALPMSLTRFMAMGAFLACLLEPNVYVVTALFCIVAFSTDLGTSAVWAFVQDIGGRHSGSVLGWGNMWGNFGAAISTQVLLLIVGDEGNWNRAFICLAISFFISGAAAAFIDARRVLEPDDSAD